MYNLGYLILCMAWQDCCLILPPYPFSLEDPDNMSIDDAWFAWPQLFFTCWLRPIDDRPRLWSLWNINYEAPTMLRCNWYFSAPLRFWTCLHKGPWIMLQPICTSRSLPQHCLWLPATWCWAGCPSFPCSSMATLLPQFTTACAAPRPEEERVRTPDSQCCWSTWQEGQQCLRGQPLALAIWPWKAAPGGLSVSETEDRCKMMSSDRAKQAMATRSSR